MNLKIFYNQKIPKIQGNKILKKFKRRSLRLSRVEVLNFYGYLSTKNTTRNSSLTHHDTTFLHDSILVLILHSLIGPKIIKNFIGIIKIQFPS